MSEFLTNPIEQEPTAELKGLMQDVETLKSAVQLCNNHGDEAFIALMKTLL